MSIEGDGDDSASGPLDSVEEKRIRDRFVHFEADDSFGTELLTSILSRAGGVENDSGESP